MTYISTVLADSPVGFYALGEASGTSATDQTANNHSGTYTSGGTAWTLAQTGLPGGDGTTAGKITAGGSNMAVSDLAAQRIVDTFTLEIWLKIGTLPAASLSVIGCAQSNGGNMEIDSAGHITIVKRNTSQLVAATVAITDTTTWHHCVATKTGATCHLYLDGADVTGSVTNATMSATTSGVNVGNNAHNALLATYAMAAWYSTVLNSTQVSTHYTTGITAPAVTANGNFLMFMR